MATFAAIFATIAGVAIVYQLVKNVGSSATPVTGLGTVSTAATSITGSLFSK